MKTTKEFTFFWGNSDPFSNWYQPATFTFNGITFVHSEQFMMFCKAMLFGDTDVAQKIMRTSNPRVHKSLGREVEGFNQKIWEEHAYNVVYVGCREKFLQNQKLLDALIDTADTELVEASPYDKIWGIGLHQHDIRAHSKETWQGKNLLGEILTVLREEIKMVGVSGMDRSIEKWWD
jgi:ribA/ribD-fused uncharacterized protein